MAKHVAEPTQATKDMEALEEKLRERDEEYRWDLQFDSDF
jgi:hypothetical protein